MVERRTDMEEGEEEQAGPQVSCSLLSSGPTASSYAAMPSSFQTVFWRVLGTLGAVVFSREGGRGEEAGGRLHSVMMIS